MSNATAIPTGDDIESALSIIEENGGSGEYETADEPQSTPRWLFPRFDGATETGDMYLSRAGVGSSLTVDEDGNTVVVPNDTDVETLCSWLAAPRNVVGGVMLLGDPGCGKTALIEAAATHAEAELLTHVCSPDDTRDSLYLRFVGEGKGDPVHPDDPDSALSPYTLGVIPYAAMTGAWLYLDEAPLLQDGVKPAAIYAAADGRKYLPGGNIDGSPLLIADGFRLVISGNPQVRGSSIPEPIASRFASTTLTVETSADMLRDLNIDDSIVAAWEGLRNASLFQPQIREMRMADYWLPLDVTQAVSAFLPEHCPESQRKAVRDMVVGYLGGSIRDDGRLVVS